jgi:triacylglycerol esterase/lipase EstA (alpha/beta hydrolase family)
VLSRLAPARRRFVLGVVALAVVLVVVLVGLSASALLRSRATSAVDQAVPGPVLLVPGYGGSVASLAALADRLRASGRDVTVVTLPDQARGDLTAQADVLGATVGAARTRTGAASVDLVGYSAGGVVARLWLSEGGGAAQTRRLVMLGSPNHGTDLARLGGLFAGACPTACQQLATDSAVLSRLDREPLPGGVVAVSLWTTQDDVVVPASSAVLDGVPSPSLQSICAGETVDHTRLPTDRLAQRLVQEALGEGALPTWGPGDCGRLSS